MESKVNIEKSVVQILTHHINRSYISWTTVAKREFSTGTGFCIKIPELKDEYLEGPNVGKVILTNEHCVHNPNIIDVRKKGLATTFRVKVVKAIIECDLAVCVLDYQHYLDNKNTRKEVVDIKKFVNDFWHDIPAMEFAQIPRKTERVFVYGYPLGGYNISITSGVVNRFQIIDTSVSTSVISIQIDAAINFGNSGGPVLDKNKRVVGVAFSGEDDRFTQNMGYIIPIFIIDYFLDFVKKNKPFINLVSLGIYYQYLSYPSIREYYKIDEKTTGILVTDVRRFQAADGKLQEGDVITHVDKLDLDNDGTVTALTFLGDRYKISGYEDEIVTFENYISLKYEGDVVELSIIRDAKKMKLKIELKPTTFLVPIIERPKLTNQFVFVEDVFLLTNLSLMYINELEMQRKGDMSACTHLYHYLRNQGLTYEDEELVVVSELYEYDHPQELYNSPIINTINDIKIRNIDHFFKKFKEIKDKKELCRITFRDTHYILVVT